MTFYELFDQLLFQEQQPYFKTTGFYSWQNKHDPKMCCYNE